MTGGSGSLPTGSTNKFSRPPGQPLVHTIIVLPHCPGGFLFINMIKIMAIGSVKKERKIICEH